MGGTGYWWYVQPPDTRHVELLAKKTRAHGDQNELLPDLGRGWESD